MKRLSLILLIAIIISCVSCSNVLDSNNRYVMMIKNGYRENSPEITYNEAFSNFFDNPKWKYFKSDQDEDVVEFTGNCLYLDTNVKVTIQFVVDENNETFEATYLELNEIPQNYITLFALINKTFEEASN